MAPKPSLEVKIEVVLDENDKKFYPGDKVEGKIFITSNQNYRLKNLRLGWTGRIQVQPKQENKDTQKYFDECWKLGPKVTKAPNKTIKGSSQVPYYHTDLVAVTDHESPEPKVELPKNKPVGFAFHVHVPNDRPLPSSTNGNSSNKIIYLLEAFIAEETREGRPAFFGQRTVPVLEPIYTRTDEMTRPQRAEQVFTVSLPNQGGELRSAMRVTLPCRGCQTGIAIPVSISIWNNMEFTRKQGISISLFRVNQIMANGRAYTSAGEKVHRIVADVNITADEKDNNQFVQTVRAALPIPKGTTPTITLEKSGLLSISYYIRVQVFAQEGIYRAPTGIESQFMMVDLPFVVGTLGTPPESPRSNGTTPLSSPRSLNGMIVSPTASLIYTELSPRLTNASGVSTYVDPRNSFSIGSTSPAYPSTLTSSYFADIPRSTSSTTNSATLNGGQVLSSSSITSPVLTNMKSTGQINENDSVVSGSNSDSGTTSASTLIDNKKSSRVMGGMFRKSSSGSNVSVENGTKKKKRSVFSSLKNLGRSNSNGSQKSVKEEDRIFADKNNPENRKEDQRKEEIIIAQPEDQATLSVSNEGGGGGVFDIFSGDDDSLYESNRAEEEQKPIEADGAGKVFNMFPDDDSDEEEAEEAVEEEEHKTKDTQGEGKVFNMFPDEDDDDDDEEENNTTTTSIQYPLLGDGDNQVSTTATIEDPLTHTNDSVTNQRLLSSHVFKMFHDSTDDEESDVEGLSIAKKSAIEEHKPNQKEQEEEAYHKPDTIDEPVHNDDHISDMSSEEEDVYDILGALARKEKLLQRKIA